jgi:FMN phosphatase YigB (HAD superfamily)
MWTHKYSTISPSATEANLESGFFKPGLVIFDKDGTLVCFHTMWTPWCTSLASRMEEETGRDMSEQIYNVLGYDEEEDKVRIGALAENTHPQIRTKIEEMLVSLKLSPNDAKEVVDNTWRDTPDDLAIKLTANLKELFKRLKRQGVKVGPSRRFCHHLKCYYAI